MRKRRYTITTVAITIRVATTTITIIINGIVVSYMTETAMSRSTTIATDIKCITNIFLHGLTTQISILCTIITTTTIRAEIETEKDTKTGTEIGIELEREMPVSGTKILTGTSDLFLLQINAHFNAVCFIIPS